MSNDAASNPDFHSYNKVSILTHRTLARTLARTHVHKVFILIGDRTSFTGDRWNDIKACV